MSYLWSLLKVLLGSKKRVAALSAVLLVLLQPLWLKLGLDLNLDQVELIVGALAAYILGQGLADMGKEAKTLEIRRK